MWSNAWRMDSEMEALRCGPAMPAKLSEPRAWGMTSGVGGWYTGATTAGPTNGLP
jgi:hypothetical protein